MNWKTYISAISTIEKYARNGKNFNKFFARISDWEFCGHIILPNEMLAPVS